MGLLAIGNPLLWWASLPCLIVLVLRAWRGRDLRIALLPLVVAALYLPWLATSRQTYIYYLAPVVPFLAVSVAAALSTSREAERQSRRAVLGWFLAGLAAGALAYPLLWASGHAWQVASSSLPLTIAAAVVGAGQARRHSHSHACPLTPARAAGDVDLQRGGGRHLRRASSPCSACRSPSTTTTA